MGIQNLIGHLKKEIELFKELISILQKETENLVSRDYKGLYETVSLKEHLVVRLTAMAGTRQALIDSAASSLCLSKAEATLSAVIGSATEGRTELEACRKTILSLSSSIQEINKVNSVVVEGSLENINKTLGFLGNFLQRSSYNPAGAFEGFAVKGSRLSEGA